jgi:hypothetical protein
MRLVPGRQTAYIVAYSSKMINGEWPFNGAEPKRTHIVKKPRQGACPRLSTCKKSRQYAVAGTIPSFNRTRTRVPGFTYWLRRYASATGAPK